MVRSSARRTTLVSVLLGWLTVGPATDGALLLTTAPRLAQAKEHGAGCAELPQLLERLRTALVLASIHRARGSALATYEVLRVTAVPTRTDANRGGCGVLGPTLARALSAAHSAPDAATATMLLEQGYVAALGIALLGNWPALDQSNKAWTTVESIEFGENCPDLFVLLRQLEGGSSDAAATIAATLAQLRRTGRCPQLRPLLEASSPGELGEMLATIRLDEKVSAGSPPSPFTRCPEVPLVREALVGAIRRTIPLFNRGDYATCQQIFAATARRLHNDIIPIGRCPAVRASLIAAATEAARAPTAKEAAAAFRREFEQIVAAGSAP